MMKIPGFTAEHALAARPAARRAVPGSAPDGVPSDDRVFPQDIHWGSYADGGCIGVGVRKYSAILWGIPWWQSWETTCAGTPGNPAGISPRVPDQCVNTVLNEWGEWHVPDKNCCIATSCFCSGNLVRCYIECPSGSSWQIVSTC
jgi:hypothetical protein